MKKTMTIYDIAKLAGVSPPVVSWVANKNKKQELVTRETRERVAKVIKQHNYVANSRARSMAMKKSFTIGLICSTGNIGDWLSWTQSALQEEQYLVIPFIYTDSVLPGRKFPGSFEYLLGATDVEGFIISCGLTEETEKQLSELSVPCVWVNSEKRENYNCIYPDDFRCGYLAVQEVLTRKVEKLVAILPENVIEYTYVKERMRGIRQAAEGAGMEVDVRIISYADLAAHYEIVNEYKDCVQPVGVVIEGWSVFSFQRAIFDCDTSVVDHFKVVLCAGVPLAELLLIDSCRVPLEQMYRTGSKMILERIKTQKDIPSIQYQPEFVTLYPNP